MPSNLGCELEQEASQSIGFGASAQVLKTWEIEQKRRSGQGIRSIYETIRTTREGDNTRRQ